MTALCCNYHRSARLEMVARIHGISTAVNKRDVYFLSALFFFPGCAKIFIFANVSCDKKRNKMIGWQFFIHFKIGVEISGNEWWIFFTMKWIWAKIRPSSECIFLWNWCRLVINGTWVVKSSWLQFKILTLEFYGLVYFLWIFEKNRSGRLRQLSRWSRWASR